MPVSSLGTVRVWSKVMRALEAMTGRMEFIIVAAAVVSILVSELWTVCTHTALWVKISWWMSVVKWV